MSEFIKFLEGYHDSLKDENKVIDVWSKIRFLDGIEDEEKKRYLALAFSKMAIDILEYKIQEKEKPCMDFDVIVFPFIRRVMTDQYKDINEIDYELLKKCLGEITLQEAYDAVCEYKKLTGEEIKKYKSLEIIQSISDRKMWEIFGNSFYNKKFDCDIEAESLALATYYYVLQVMKRDKKEAK